MGHFLLSRFTALFFVSKIKVVISKFSLIDVNKVRIVRPGCDLLGIGNSIKAMHQDRKKRLSCLLVLIHLILSLLAIAVMASIGGFSLS